MTRCQRMSPAARSPASLSLMVTLAAVTLAVPGCDALNPAFVDFLGNSIAPGTVTPIGPPSSGHVVVALRNNTVFDEQLLESLVQNGLDRTLLDDPDLRPRVRMRLRITFTNNESLDVEFNDGSSTIVDPRIDASMFPDLVETPQDNVVVQCDVARVDLLQLPSVFVPAFFETIRINPGDEDQPPFREQVNTAPPQYVRLQVDDVDEFGNTVLQRNIDIRDLPAPAIGPNCGSVVTITMSGTLRLPFEVNEFGAEVPGVLDTNNLALAASPGRYRVVVGIR